MQNLIIHPQDASTDFLKPIYSKVKRKTVVSQGANPKDVDELIKKSDRIMMMGHGSLWGLFSLCLFQPYGKRRGVVIRPEESAVLKNKPQNIYIWCHANKFVEDNDLHGFYSGMFISEVMEAVFCGLQGVTQTTVTKSNDAFSEIVSKYIDLPKNELYEKVIKEYGELAKTNPVAAYNVQRLYVR